ncbi:hypothetical protein CTAYLR_000407 [Chrysophaeum taylorii]|uniref:Uncharacterized protein n=1 Tax=Chrysophaeum taylorii TaxID=2483200 RepID=A0AAD7UHR7_9STRA|nr:hypothetical protein CTAYLR_000407 [Chrysophaeum taylorii]
MTPRDRYLAQALRPPRGGQNARGAVASVNTPDSLDDHLTDLGACTPPAPPESEIEGTRDLARPPPHLEAFGSVASSARSGLPPRASRRSTSERPQRRRREDELGDAMNEKLVKQPRDQLFFSRKARPVANFEPYTLDQYRLVKPEKYYELGKLQPDLNREDLIAKRKNADRVREFSRNLRAVNAQQKTGVDKPVKKDTPSEPSKREKALEFARKIPKPKVHPKPPDEADILSHHAKAARHRSDDDEGAEEGGGLELTRLEQLEAKHDHMRALADNIRRQFYYAASGHNY